MTEPLGPADLDRLSEGLSLWLAAELETNPAIDSVEEDRTQRWWFVRLRGEAKEVTAVHFRLNQRTLSYETYVMPYPIDNREEFFELLLRLNYRMYGLAFSIGAEEGVYLRGQIDARSVADPDEMDRVLGSLFTWSEDYFGRLIRLGYASKA